MELPLQITFRHMDSSVAIEAEVRSRAEKLDRVYPRITSCRVVIESPHRHHQQGKLYHVAVDVTVPGGELVASRQPGARHAHEDVYVAIRDGFDAVERQLAQHAHRERRDVKTHGELPRARVAKLVPAGSYGFLETADGREIYFHAHSVRNLAFEQLLVGDQVHFSEEQGEDGPQASVVHVTASR